VTYQSLHYCDHWTHIGTPIGDDCWKLLLLLTTSMITTQSQTMLLYNALGLDLHPLLHALPLNQLGITFCSGEFQVWHKMGPSPVYGLQGWQAI